MLMEVFDSVDDDLLFDYYGATGGLLGDFYPFLCGGRKNGTDNSNCFLIDTNSRKEIALNFTRYNAGSAAMGNAIYITGGQLGNTRYSHLSNKRRATFILFEEIFQALRSYSRPYVYLFLKKIIENLGENRKKWLFSTIFSPNVSKEVQ